MISRVHTARGSISSGYPQELTYHCGQEISFVLEIAHGYTYLSPTRKKRKN